MASCWNYIWGESWKEYIQRSAIAGDLEKAHQQSTSDMIGAISGHTASILVGIKGQPNSAIYNGFVRFFGQMPQIDHIVEAGIDLDVSFQWGFGHVIAQIYGMNDSLNTLFMLAREDTQRLAYKHFEIARDAFRRQLYEDCLEELGKAISGDVVSSGYKQEWRFHQMQGVIRLGFFGCEPSLVEPAQAEQSFLLAAKYYEMTEFPEGAAIALLSAGWAAFVQGKLPEALEYTDQAVSTNPDLTEAVFQAAKFRMADGRPEIALPLLRTAIEANPAYMVKAAADGDFQLHQDELDGFLEAMREEQMESLASKVPAWLAEAEVWAATVAEVAACTDQLGRWRSLLEGNWGLLDLFEYARLDADDDHEIVVGAHDVGVKRQQDQRVAKDEDATRDLEHLRNTWQIESRAFNVDRWLDDSCQVQEQGQNYECNASGTVQRQSMRQVEIEKLVRVNLLGEVGQVFPEECFRFVRIPAGEFQMGSPEDEKHRGHNEKIHTVSLTKPFELMTTPVTQALWEFVMGGNPSHFKGRNRPVERVRWSDVQEFISKLNAMFVGKFFRLPTEAEWEYACRAGTTYARYSALDLVAWYMKIHICGIELLRTKDETHPVGQKQPNAWGLYDMLGNVDEWCQDWFGSYPNGDVVDPVGPSSGPYRVCRGGSWIMPGDNIRAAARQPVPPGNRYATLGFRLARSLP